MQAVRQGNGKQAGESSSRGDIICSTVPMAATQASKGKVGLVRLLLQRGADPSKQDCTGSTALHRAASTGAELRLWGGHLDGHTCPALYCTHAKLHGSVRKLNALRAHTLAS